MDLDQERAQVALALAQVVDRAAQDGRVLAVAAPLGVVGERAQAEGDTGEVLHRAVVQVGGDAPALLAGGLDRVGEQPLALVVAALEAAGHRPRERDLEDEQDDQPAQQRRRERAQQPFGARGDRAEALVDLEEHLGPVRRADRRVGLQQLALLAFVAVLGLGEVELLLAEPVALPDQRRLVGVQDAPVLGPDLHAHDRRAQDLARDGVVEGGERAPVAAQHAVGQARRLDEPSLHLHLVARVALGLVNGHRAQREEAADHDDDDRDERAEHEARDRRDDARRGITHDEAILADAGSRCPCDLCRIAAPTGRD